MSVAKVSFLRGLSGSGKSTIATEIAQRTGAAIVNMDAIRAMLGLPYNRQNEKLAVNIMFDTVVRSVKAGIDVIIDNTHLHSKWPSEIVALLWESGLEVEYELIDLVHVPVEECIRRDAVRFAEGKRAVGEQVIYQQARELDKQVLRGLWTLTSITGVFPTIVPVVESDALPPAVICDVDGTVSLFEHHRSPYETAKCLDDIPHKGIHYLLDAIAATHYTAVHREPRIILCSGRDEEFREPTEQWAKVHTVRFDELLMRSRGDTRRDSVVKLEIFNQNIRNKYNVLFAIDDRTRVVKIWRALGITTLQCAEGDF